MTTRFFTIIRNMKPANHSLTAGYAGPDYFCGRKREAEELVRNLDNDWNAARR